MLVIEGPDNVGKTRLANDLVLRVQKQGIPAYYSHMSKPPDCFDYHRDYEDWMSYWAVQDRFHIGNIVYGDLFRGSSLTHSGFRYVERLLRLHFSLVVLIYASKIEDVFSNWVDEDEMYSREKACAVTAYYDNLARGEMSTGGLRPKIDVCYDISEHGYPAENPEFIDCVVSSWHKESEEQWDKRSSSSKESPDC